MVSEIRKKYSPGFTFVELLITMTVLGIISTLFLSNFRPSLNRARDTQRKSDLAQYRIALENYAAAHNSLFPTGAVQNIATGVCPSALRPNFIASCPDDPFVANGAYNYRYWSNGTAYTIWGQLDGDNYWQICSDGRSTEEAAAPSGLCPTPTP